MKILYNNSNLDTILKNISIDHSVNTVYIEIINPDKINYRIIDNEIIFSMKAPENTENIIKSNYLEKYMEYSGYFIRNCFICTPEEYFKPVLKKYKSANDINLIIPDNNLISNHESDIIKYSLILYLIIKNKIVLTIKADLTAWVQKIYDDNTNLLKFYEEELKKSNDSIKILSLIIDIFTKQNISKKNIIGILKKIKIDILEINNSDMYKDLIDWLDKEFNRLINDKFILAHSYSTIKEKLQEQNKINKVINLIIDDKIKPHLIIAKNEKKEIIKTIDNINKEFNKFNDLVNKQLNIFFNELYIENNKFIKTNFKNIKIYNKLLCQSFNTSLFLGKNEIEHCNIIIKIPNLNILFKKK